MNWLAILVGALINMVVGSLWYSPILFAKPWMKMIGKKETEKMAPGSQMGKLYGITFVGALLMSYVLMHFVQVSQATSILWGMKVAFWLWLGFTAATTISDYLFAGRPIKLYAINAGYYLVVALIVGGLFGVWH